MSLERFCGIDSSRAAMLKPCEIDGFVYATDGHIAGRMPVTAAGAYGSTPEALKLFVRVPALFDEAKKTVVQWIQILTLPDRPPCEKCKGDTKEFDENECPECNGDGELELESDYHTYEVTCKTCDGDGEVLGRGVCKHCRGSGFVGRPNYIGCDAYGVRLNLELLHRIKDLPGLRIGLHSPGNLLGHYFTWDHGDGVLMPLRIVDSETLVVEMTFEPCQIESVKS